MVESVLGPARFLSSSELAERGAPVPGVVAGLVWTEAGGQARKTTDLFILRACVVGRATGSSCCFICVY